ncbi:hypothetical protein [Micromonospora chersina]|uniref:hypothetical protein n=1 Tax=Micromonospora chersina TaxID=47854 RepID=UPI00340DB8B8
MHPQPNPIIRPDLHTDPATIAAELRRVADALDAIAGTKLSPVVIQVNLQAVRYHGTADERILTVDTLGMALVGHVGKTDDDENDEQRGHRLPYQTRTLGHCDVAVYTGLKDGLYGGGSR